MQEKEVELEDALQTAEEMVRLLTGADLPDADLLSLREVRGIPILDIPTFWQRLSGRPT